MIQRTSSLFFAPLLAATALVGCVNHLHVPPEEAATHDTVFVGEDEALLELLSVDEDGFSVTPVFALPEGETATRVAFRFDAASAFSVQARSSVDGADFTEWQDVDVTFQEEAAFNAKVDVVEGTTQAQLRFLAPMEAGLRFLAVEMFVYEPTPPFDDGIDSTVNEAEQGLAGDGIVVTRAQWGARATNCGGTHTPNRITVHHTASPNNDSMSGPARMRQLQSFFIDTRGWCDMGYHFLVAQDGKVYEGRPERRVGAHAANANANNAGVSFVGTFTNVAPSEAMMNAGARIIKSLGSFYGIALNRTQVKGHRQVGTTQTECPGNALYPRLENLIARAQGTPNQPQQPATFCNEAGSSKTGSWCVGDAVVTCNAGAQTSKVTCTAGCQSMPAGTPDQCRAPPPATPTGFDDVAADHWAASQIAKATQRGALAGCDSNSFCPATAVTKAELAHAIATVETEPVDLAGVPAFTDVPERFRASVREVVARGIMQACAGGGFCGGEVVSRAALSVYVRRAQGLAEAKPATPTFGDVAASHWAFTAIERIAADGISGGCSVSPKRFCPADNVTRAQAAVFLANGWDL